MLELAVNSLAWAVVLLLYAAWAAREHRAERRAWERERAALIEKLTGVTITATVEPDGPRRVYGTDADEYAVEQRRRARAGMAEDV